MFALLTVTFRQMTQASALAVLVFGAAALGVVASTRSAPRGRVAGALLLCVVDHPEQRLCAGAATCLVASEPPVLRHDLAEAMASFHGQVIRSG